MIAMYEKVVLKELTKRKKKLNDEVE